jgi:hypothetical protein
VLAARGDPADRLTETDVVEKARAALDPVLGRPAVSAWISEAMSAFEDASACKRLAKDFAAAMNRDTTGVRCDGLFDHLVGVRAP